MKAKEEKMDKIVQSKEEKMDKIVQK